MKKLKYIFSFVAVFFAATVCASASVISFQIIQHDKSQSNVRESSYVVENALFDFFFDKGFIATNSPTETTSKASEDLKVFSQALAEAKMGHCNYFVVLTIDYDVKLSTNTKGSFLSNIDSISWELYNANTSTKIADGTREVGVVSVQKNNERGIINFINEIAMDIYDEL